MKKQLSIIFILSFVLTSSAAYASQEGRIKPKEGLYKEFYENGKVKFETVYKNHLRNGITKTYFENGRIWSEYTYRNGIKHGLAKIYFENGKLKSLFNYQNGVPEGLQKLYNENGRLKMEKMIKEGNIFYIKEYDSAGKPLN